MSECGVYLYYFDLVGETRERRACVEITTGFFRCKLQWITETVGLTWQRSFYHFYFLIIIFFAFCVCEIRVLMSFSCFWFSKTRDWFLTYKSHQIS